MPFKDSFSTLWNWGVSAYLRHRGRLRMGSEWKNSTNSRERAILSYSDVKGWFAAEKHSPNLRNFLCEMEVLCDQTTKYSSTKLIIPSWKLKQIRLVKVKHYVLKLHYILHSIVFFKGA